MKNGIDNIKSSESAETRDACLLFGAAKMIIRGFVVFLGVVGAVAAPIAAHLLTPEQIERMSLWLVIPAGLCITIYFLLEVRWWWIREYRDATHAEKTDAKYAEWK